MAQTYPNVPGYRIKRKLAIGGMSEVFVAEKDGREVAVKLMLPERVDDKGAQNKMQYESTVGMALPSHQNVVDVNAIGTAGKRPYIEMEHFVSTTLRHIIAEQKQMPIPMVAHYGLQTARALEFLHKNSVIHLDMKPENLLVNEARLLKIIDLGICTSPSRARWPWMRRSEGSPVYMAPEQIRRRRVDVTTDIYSLGCILYEMVCGRPPYVAQSEKQLLNMHVGAARPRPPSESNSRVGHYLEDLILSCLEKEQSKRPPSAVNLVGSLSRASQGVE